MDAINVLFKMKTAWMEWHDHKKIGWKQSENKVLSNKFILRVCRVALSIHSMESCKFLQRFYSKFL